MLTSPHVRSFAFAATLITSILIQVARVEAVTCGAWSAINGAGPGDRREAPMVFDPVRNRMLMFGGYRINQGAFNDVWEFDLATLHWHQLNPSGTGPSPRASSSMVYDAPRDRLIIFGGTDFASQPFADAWSLSLAGPPTWLPLLTTGASPPGREEASLVVDPGRDRLLLYGGLMFTAPGVLGDLWELDLSGTPSWNQIVLSGAPPGRYGHGAIYNGSRDRMIVYGGAVNGIAAGDVWALNLAPTPSWQELMPYGAAPAGRVDATTIFDTARSRMLVFGGYSTQDLNDTWALSLKYDPMWVQLTPEGPPEARILQSGAWDPGGEQLVIYGGYTHTTESDLGDGARLVLAGGYALDLAVQPPEGGAVTRIPDQDCYTPGQIVTLTATPAIGYLFAGWAGDAGGDTNPLLLTMDGHKAVLARFETNPTPTLLLQFEANPRDAGIELVWRFGEIGRVASASIERAIHAEGPWNPIALDTRERAGATVALDRDVERDHTYWYRLSAALTDGKRIVFEPVSAIAGGSPLASAITTVSPNPGAGPIAVQFAIARQGRVRVSIFDPMGREAAILVDEPKSAGRYATTWKVDSAGLRSRSGLYFVRLAAPDRTEVRRIVRFN